MASWLRTVVFFAGWVTATGAIGLMALPLLVSRRATWRLAQGWAGATLCWLRISCGVVTRVEGGEQLPAGAAIIASKHQSAWDTLVLWRSLKCPAFVMKRELYYIPVFGWYLWRTGQVAIDRRAGRTAMDAMVRGAQRTLGEGRKLVIFPEGTRVPPGQVKPFRSGIARLSHALNMAVIPAALNAGRFWPKHTIKKSPGTATLKFLPAMAPCGEDTQHWLEQLQRAINTASETLGESTNTACMN